MTDWAIPQRLKLKYTQLFNEYDRSQNGFLTGLQCRDILLKSGLPKATLALIWNLSDIDEDGQLNREEFILAMYLVYLAESGQNLPRELNSDLIPPSYRQNVPKSYNLLLSDASASSSLNGSFDGLELEGLATSINVKASTSFEERRRENFEKGQVELEKRRIRIIEQQIEVLREQLSISTKEAFEAEAKVATLITSSDAKMKLINSLKDQLKKVNDRRAYLDKEEEKLDNIANDLRLVDSTQMEPKIRQQITIYNLNNLFEEKESRVKELSETVKRIEESRGQLIATHERANEIYENYKKKLQIAKERLSQFINYSELKFSIPNTSEGIQPTTLHTGGGLETDASEYTNLLNDHLVGEKFQNQSTSCSQTILSSSIQTNGLHEPVNNEQSLTHQKSKKYRVLFPFEARSIDELSINPGDIIIASDRICEPGWLIGELKNQVGLFPETFVESFQEEKEVPIPLRQGQFKPNGKDHNPTIISNLNISAPSVDELGCLNVELNGRPGSISHSYALQLEESEVDQQKTSKSCSIEGWDFLIEKRPRPFDIPDESRSQKVDQNSRIETNRKELGHLVRELIETESDYVDDLRLFFEVYIKPLSSSFDVSTIFSNWNELIKVHDLALYKLANCKKSDHLTYYNLVFEIYFNLISSIVDLYTTFCSQQSKAARRYEAKLASDIRFKQSVNECQRKIARIIEEQMRQAQWNSVNNCETILNDNSRLQRNSNLPVSSFMIKPMQRITKYSLIFDRLLNIIDKNGPYELKVTAEKLKLSAQSLCEQVNHACKLREDHENNERKLRWARTHIQSSDVDSMLIESQSLAPSDHNSQTELSFDHETTSFSSMTELHEPRQLIKAGSLLTEHSNKEVVLFLFNDLLFITRAKGSPTLRVKDVFSSSRAQRTYYKLLEDPIYLRDITLHTSVDKLLKGQSPSSEDHFFEVGFSDRSTGATYILSALSKQEQLCWIEKFEALCHRTKSVC